VDSGHPCRRLRTSTQGKSYGEISAKTGIPKASLHRYLKTAVAGRDED